MKKILIFCVIFVGLVLFFSGCTEQDNSGTNGGTDTGKTVTMTAMEVYNDMNMEYDEDSYNLKLLFNSLEDGDTLIIHDTIDDISYDPDTDITKVSFNTSEGGFTGSYNVPFEGDLTNTYSIGDTVKITDKIKYVKFTDDSTGDTITYEIELFEKTWTNKEDYFATQGGALPATCITKV